ncbi:MAG: hypothetical protein HYU31_17025 [Deltaproteobacteria bacterium]|nr:hypothetical protein [Deltaproteobacteria bacterium]
MPQQAHLLSDDTLKRLGYRLLCSVYAEYEWRGLRRDSDPDVLDSFLARADEEISELLVSLSALARAADDELGTLTQLEKVFPNGVGTVDVDGHSKPLSPREACNKIIHAKSLDWDFPIEERNPIYNDYYVSQGLDVKGSFRNPKAILSGVHGRVPWRCTISIVPFVVAVSNWDVGHWRFA